MRLRYVSICLSEDFSYDADFLFQTAFLSYYLSWALRKGKYELNDYNHILIRGKTNPNVNPVFSKYWKCIEIETYFDEEKYRQLYPAKNYYPLHDKLLVPVENEALFADFLITMVLNALDQSKNDLNLPYDFLTNRILDFRKDGFINEWIYKKKLIKPYGLKVTLLCKLTINHFSLELIAENKTKEVFRKEILKTLPSTTIYENEFKDIVVEGNNLIVTKKYNEPLILFSIPISDLLSQ